MVYLKKLLLLNSIQNIIVIISFSILIYKWPNTTGEDIQNARINYLSNFRNDFWGPVCSFIYGNFPDILFGWQTNLFLVQLLLSTFFILKIYVMWFPIPLKNVSIFYLTFSYFSLNFATTMTRDGLMFTLLLVAIYYSIKINLYEKYHVLNSSISIVFFILAFSIRPWMAVSCLFLIRYFFLINRSRSDVKFIRRFVGVFLVGSFFALTPYLLNVAIFNSLNFTRSYPEQQVILMDLSSTYCWSTNRETVLKAKSTLIYFYENNELPLDFCSQFRPNTWIWLSKDPNPFGTLTSTTKLKTIDVSSDANFEEIRFNWLKIIWTDPSTYLQIKLMQSSQLFIGGESFALSIFHQDTRDLSFFSNSKLFIYICDVLRLPWDLAISLHGLSYCILFIFFVYLIFSSFQITYFRNSVISAKLLTIIFFSAAWFILTTIAFIGDNGRYLYTGTILTYLLLTKYIFWSKIE